jgi:hypothetical protein
MIKLRLTVSFHPDETPMSFASRLAARNGTRARPFCLDFGLRFQDVVDGEEETFRGLARLAGVDGNALLSNAFVKSGQLRWTHCANVLHRTVLRRERIAICPACALADIEAEPKLRPEAAVYGRLAWLIDPVRTCPDHRTPLVVVSEDLRPRFLHDFAFHVANAIPRLAALAADAPRRDLGGLENYALARLHGRASSPFLDRMPLSAAVRICETAGAVALFSPKVGLEKLDDDERLAAGGRGFEIIAPGAVAFRTFLDGLMAAVPPHSRLDGPGVAFGRLNELLRVTSRNPDYEPIRDVARQYVEENFPLAEGAVVFGKPIEQRKVHSIHTLAKENSIHSKLLRKHLRAEGLISEADMVKSDHSVRIEAGKALKLAERLGATLSRTDAMEYLNAPMSQMRILLKHGFVRPSRRMTGLGAWNRYRVTDLDALLEKLGAKSPRADVHRNRLCNIPVAARRCCCSGTDIVRLILDGKLSTRTVSSTRGYMSILVDPKAVRRSGTSTRTGRTRPQPN